VTNNNPGCAAGPWVRAAFDALLGGRWPDLRGFSWWQQRWNDDRGSGSLADMIADLEMSVTSALP
jgi:hypothetical protein